MKIIRLLASCVIVAALLLVSCAQVPTEEEEAAAPAEFEVTSLDIVPSETVAGETVIVTAQVTNIGGSEGTYAAILTVDGVDVQTRDATLAPGATGTVTFSLMKDSSGTYNIEIGGLSRSLVVRTVEPEYNLSNRRLCRIRFSNTARNEGPGSLSELHSWLIVPRETLAQKVISFDIEPEPSAYLFDEWGQKIAYYKLQDVAPGTEFTVVWTVEAELYDIKYDIDPSRVGSFE